jgi:hypothetical protein
MQTQTALFTLAHRRRDVRMTCDHCGHTTVERIEFLVDRFGPLYPLDRVAWNTKCRKCGRWEMRARAL